MKAGTVGLAVVAALAFTAGGAAHARAQTRVTEAHPGTTDVVDGTTLLRRAGASRARGSRTAPVTVYEVADFQCPFCAEFANNTFARIDSAYIAPGKVQWVFVNLPLTMHMNAFQAAEAALCAGAVANKFWEMHEKLYASQREWTGAADPQPIFLGYARAAGVPEAPYAACVSEDRVWPVIMQDAMYATASRIDGTPTYIVGQKVVAVGAKDFAAWQQILDTALADATKPAPAK